MLVIGKLDRLARNARFLLSVVEGSGEAGVVFCDLPTVPAAGLKDDSPQARPATPKAIEPSPVASISVPETGGKRRPAREGKKGVLGHFSPELSRASNILAIEESTTVQALMGEAFGCLCALAENILLGSAGLLARLRVDRGRCLRLDPVA